MECEVCTEYVKERIPSGKAGKGSGSQGCRGAEHALWNALVRWLSGQNLNRPCNSGGDEGNRQPEIANPAKCRDSLQRHFRPELAPCSIHEGTVVTNARIRDRLCYSCTCLLLLCLNCTRDGFGGAALYSATVKSTLLARGSLSICRSIYC
jgi:hypothetical protein